MVFFFRAAIVLTLSPITQAAQWTSEAVKFREEDFTILPPFCRAKIAQQNNREIQEYYIRRYGQNWGNMHHYCFGLKALNLAYRDFNNKAKREYFLKQAVNEFDYVLEHADQDFSLRPEVLIQRGRALTQSRNYDEAKESIEEALKTDPKSVDAWVALSDLYSMTGKNLEAIKVLEKAIEITGNEHKKITARLDDLRKRATR